MGERTGIQWTDATFNPWWGCTKISPGCDHCYAERDSKRFGQGWGPDAPRREFGDKHWDEPLRWNKAAEKRGVRMRVFCASMADVFDKDAPVGARERLWELIERTPWIDWQLLTKRIGNVGRMIPDRWSAALPANVWLGISVVNQEEADRDIPKLLAVKTRVRFLSCEPLLGPINLPFGAGISWCPICKTCVADDIGANHEAHHGVSLMESFDPARHCASVYDMLHWIIVGGESGHAARPMHPVWARSLRDQCVAAGVPFFFKQWGEWAPHSPCAGGDLGGDVRAGRVRIVHPTGEDDVEVSVRTGGYNTIPGSRYMARVGKKAAGRLLAGADHSEFPA